LVKNSLHFASLCVKITQISARMYLASYHPGVAVEEIKANTGWDLLVADDVHETPPPTAEELTILRRHDPEGLWTK
jgi:glutaconate CoA-transferase subunit B